MNAIRNTSLPLAGAVGAIGLTAALTARKRFTARLDALGAIAIGVGPVSIHADDAITVVCNEMDRLKTAENAAS